MKNFIAADIKIMSLKKQRLTNCLLSFKNGLLERPIA